MLRSSPCVVVHAADPVPLAAIIKADHPHATIVCCNTYAALPAVIEAQRPDVVYSIRFDGTTDYPRDALLGPSGPRWISVGGSGVDHLGEWDPKVTIVTNAAGVAAQMMAEYVFGGILHFTLDIPGLDVDRRAGRWRSNRTMRPLSTMTLLVVGAGQTGRAVAHLGQTFGMHVVGTRARRKDTPGFDAVHASDALADLVPNADAIVVCVPLVETTRALIDNSLIQRMKRSVIVADISRGGVVCQDALAEAVRNGMVGGVILDVFETEPLPQSSDWWRLPRVIMSPHCSSVYDGWEAASTRLFSDNLSRWIADETLHNVVDPKRGY